MKSIKEQKLIYHLTCVDNLVSIFKIGLCSRKDLTNVVPFNDIANDEIIKRRTELNILHFVPFHFFCKNPFDGVVIKDNPQKSFCYITLTREYAKSNNFKIIPTHPLNNNAALYDDYDKGFAAIDWETMDKRDYKDEECKQICMAECLAPQKIEIKDFHSIVFQSENQKSKFENCLKSQNYNFSPPYIDSCPDWFAQTKVSDE